MAQIYNARVRTVDGSRVEDVQIQSWNPNGVMMITGRSRLLIPWHRVQEIYWRDGKQPQ